MRSRTLLTLLLALLLASNLPYSSAAGEAKAPHLSLPQGVSTLQLPEGQGLAYSPGDLAYAEAFRTQLKGDTIIVVTGSEGLRLSGGVDDGALRAKATLPRGCEDLEPMVHAYLGRVSIGEIAMGYTRVSCGGGMAEVLVDLDGVLALAHPDPGELMTITITLAPGAALLIIAFQPAPEPRKEGPRAGSPL
ncbi:hypothetical protein [Aeropyrum camini]|uniref:hypothetical protein n=1 Tax=Aeropyrum camini TaxID=229980 RepID=UPI000788BDA8|nr:hypothetical protein [Aeropyrum camini]